MRIAIYKLSMQEKVLYNLGWLLEKLCKSKKIGIFCDSGVVEAMDRALWTFSTNSFLPHCTATGNDSDIRQPVLISGNLAELKSREIICVFDNSKLFETIKQNHDITDVIYMTQEDIDVENLQKATSEIDKSINVDVFAKQNNKWIRL